MINAIVLADIPNPTKLSFIGYLARTDMPALGVGKILTETPIKAIGENSWMGEWHPVVIRPPIPAVSFDGNG